MGFFDILGDCISSSLNAIESVGEAIGDAAAGTADAVGNAISFTLTTAENVGAGVGNAVASVAESAVELGHGIVDTVCENPGTTVLVAVGAVTTGGLATVGAPAIASTLGAAGILGPASTGAAISGLKGAALTSASLAKIGGGALAVGGYGVAGGTAVVGTAGAAAGATAGAAVAKAI